MNVEPMNDDRKKDNIGSDSRRKKYLLDMMWLLFIPFTLISVFIAEQNHEFIENVYSTSVFPAVAKLLPFQYMPYFSFFEVLLFSLPVILLFLLVIFIVSIVRKKKERLWRTLKLLQRILIIAGVCYFLFYFLWGYNYYRQPYSVIAGLPEMPSTKGELYALCSDLVDEANIAREKLLSNDDGTLAYEPTISELQTMANLAYEKAKNDDIPGIIDVKGYAKPLASSRLISYTGIVGVYFPYTGEPNFNNDILSPSKGGTICHEMAHRQGFAREDEANFLAYVICTNSENDYLRYAGYFLALDHAMNRLYGADRDAYRELRDLYCDGLAADMSAKRAYWKQFEGSLEERVTQLNDDFLKTHNLSDGVQSYGRMVDLMLAQKRLEDI